jgi:hypothetical protein
MNDNLKSAVNKMGMSECPTGLKMSVQLLLEHSPKELDKIRESFSHLTEDEASAFDDFVNDVKNKKV